jgi:zinc and cadmium transporter
MCPLGAIGFFFGLAGMFAQQQIVVGCALAFAAGVFLCISLADLLPEVAFHTHDRMRLTVALLIGIALAWAIGFLEPAHVHDAPHEHSSEAHRHLHE